MPTMWFKFRSRPRKWIRHTLYQLAAPSAWGPYFLSTVKKPVYSTKKVESMGRTRLALGTWPLVDVCPIRKREMLQQVG